MADLAAHLIDDVPGGLLVWQWVLTLPHRLRYALARDHKLCRAPPCGAATRRPAVDRELYGATELGQNHQRPQGDTAGTSRL